MIVLQDGHEYEGELLEAGPQNIRFRQQSGEQLHPRSEVVHIRLQKRRQWHKLSQAEAIDDDTLQRCRKQSVDPAQHPGAGSVTLHRKILVTLQSPLAWRQSTRSIIRVLNEHGEGRSIQQLAVRKDSESASILHGISIRPDGTVLHLRDTAIQHESPYSRYPRYDKVLHLRCALPEGKPGTLMDFASEVSHRATNTGGAFSADYLFGQVEPSFDLIVEIQTPTNCPLRWQVLNDPEKTVEFSQSESGGTLCYRWHRARAPQLLPEPDMPPLADIVPRLVVAASRDDWRDVASAVSTRLRDCDRRYGAPPALPKGVAPDIRSLWQYISRNIQEIPVSTLASGRFPGDLTTTWRLKEGTSFDRTYLLYRWLRQHGHSKVRWFWVRPLSYGQAAADVPALASFSIPGLLLEGPQPTYVILGDDLSAFGEPVASLGGSPCLIAGRGLGQFPLPSPSWNGTDRDVRIRLDKLGDADVTELVHYRGPAARALRTWRNYTQEEILNLITSYVSGIDSRAQHPRYRLIGNPTLNTSSIELELTYRIPRFANVGPALCSLLPPWLEFSASSVGRNTRHYPMLWNAPGQDSIAIQITPPPGFKPYSQPASATIESPIVNLAAEAELAGESLQYRLRYCRPALRGRIADYPTFKHCLEKRAELGRQYWVWKTD
jgi:hypothetical protein